MEKYAWKATIKEGCLEEYKRRHDALPEEMKALLREADILIMEKDPITGAQPLLTQVFTFD